MHTHRRRWVGASGLLLVGLLTGCGASGNAQKPVAFNPAVATKQADSGANTTTATTAPPASATSTTATTGDSSVASPTTVASTTPTTLIAQSPAWAAEGTQLKQGVAGMQSPDGDGDFAYQSLPVDIAADGMYTLDFGPVDSRFNPTPSPGAPFALTYDLPSDAQFKMVVEGGGTLVSLNGEQYYEAQADVTQFVAPYPQFSAWIYS